MAAGRMPIRRQPPLKVASTWISTLLGKARIFEPWLRLRSIEPEADLGEVGHEDIGEIDHHGAAAHGVDAEDRQGHQDRVGVVLLDRLLQRRARRAR